MTTKKVKKNGLQDSLTAFFDDEEVTAAVPDREQEQEEAPAEVPAEAPAQLPATSGRAYAVRKSERKTRRIDCLIRPSLYDEAKKAADEEGLTFNEFVAVALENKINSHKRKVK